MPSTVVTAASAMEHTWWGAWLMGGMADGGATAEAPEGRVHHGENGEVMVWWEGGREGRA